MYFNINFKFSKELHYISCIFAIPYKHKTYRKFVHFIYGLIFVLQIGISCDKDRAAIMLAVENYLAEIKLNESRSPIMPSAPLEEASTSNQDYNVQNINMMECVICLDLQVCFS